MQWKAGRRVINRLRKKHSKKNGVVPIGVLDGLEVRFAAAKKRHNQKQAKERT